MRTDSDAIPLLRVITRLNVGGPARQALLLTRALRPDFATTLVAGKPPKHEGELQDEGVDVSYVPLTRHVSPIVDVRAAYRIRRLLQELHPQIVHTHMAKAGALARGIASTLRRRPRLVHTFHGHVLEGYFDPRVSRRLISIERFLARRTDVLVAVSPQIRDELLALGIGQPGSWRVVPLGLDLGPLLGVEEPSGELRRKIGISEDVPLVGALGRFARIKGHLTLIEAVARVRDVHLALLGDGEERPRIKAAIERLGIADRVHLVSWWRDVASAISDMDVVALTSLNEGTPVSLIEAAAAGRPVVATDVGGVRFVVTDGETGLLTPAGDIDAIADAIRRLIEDDSLRRRMGQAARENVRDRFSAARLVADIRSLYMELLGSTRP